MDTIKFWTNDYNDKIWVKTNSHLHKKIQEVYNKEHNFDMIVASELNLGIISAMAFENSHKSQDVGFFVNKLIEQCAQTFPGKDLVIF